MIGLKVQSHHTSHVLDSMFESNYDRIERQKANRRQGRLGKFESNYDRIESLRRLVVWIRSFWFESNYDRIERSLLKASL